MKFVLECILVRVPYILMVLSIFIVKVDRTITCFYVCVVYVLYDSWVSTDLSVSIKTTTTTTKITYVNVYHEEAIALCITSETIASFGW